MAAKGQYLETATKPRTPVQDWSELYYALSRLDGEVETRVSLQSSSDAVVVVGGGNLGRYLVVYTENPALRGSSVTLIEPSMKGCEVELNTSQGIDTYPSEMGVTLHTVLRAVRYFLENNGAADPTLTWQGG